MSLRPFQIKNSRRSFKDDHLAGPTGFEPAIFSVTGRRDRPASLRAHVIPVYLHRESLAKTLEILPVFPPDSNLQPSAFINP